MTRGIARLLALALLFGSGRLGATPGHAYGFGARASALGGAVSADWSDAGSLFYNPALLSLAPHSQLLVGYRAVAPSLQTNQQDAGAAGLHAIDGAALARGRFLAIPVGFALGFALSNGHLSRALSVPADEPRWVLRETLPELFDLAAALALRPTSWLSLGAGSGFLASARGGFRVSGDAVLADGKGAEYDSQLRHAVDAELASARYLLLGAELELPQLWAASARPIDTSIGLSFRDEVALTQAFEGSLGGTVDAGLPRIPVSYSFETRSLLAFQPRQLVLGASVRRAALRVNLDLAFEQWSRYPSPVARSGSQVEAELPPGISLALPANTELPAATRAGFNDRSTWRAGLEQKLELPASGTLSLRAGYAYLPSPAPRHSPTAQLLDASEHVFSLGGGISWPQLSRYLPHGAALDAYALYGHLPNRRLERAGQIFLAKGHAFSAGLGLTLALAKPVD